jgi:hypothetical protein
MKRKKEYTSQGDEFRDYFIFQFQRNVINFYKRHLTVIEDIATEHSIMMRKLKGHVDPKILKDIDYFNKERYSYIRKKTLDAGNEVIRDFEKNIDLLDIKLKNKNHE